jgi:hypothetical protein
MAKKRVFKTDFGEASHITDPETLFRDLRGRSPEIRHLWSHQADLLRAYYKQFQQTKDASRIAYCGVPPSILQRASRLLVSNQTTRAAGGRAGIQIRDKGPRVREETA